MTDSTVTHQQRAYDYVKNHIITRGYRPGQYINDTQIAAELDISRTPVREAFHRLENDGLLINEARRGWRVYSLSLEDIHEIFDVKEVVEGMIARKASECEDGALREDLSRALQRMREASDDGDSDEWLQSDFALHDVLFAMAKNERAHRIVTNLNDQWHRVRIGYVAMQARMQQSTIEHETFVKAILDHDPESAEFLMHEHLNGVRQELVRLLVNVVLPFVENGV